MVPGLGHVFPVVPLAWATQVAGHDVLVATTGPNLLAVAQAGLQAVDVSPHIDVMQVLTRAGSQGIQAQRQRSDEDRRARGMKLFGEIGNLMADGIVQAARQSRADVLVYTPWNTAGLLAAAAIGIPAVVHGLGLTRPKALTAMTVENMADAQARHGLARIPTEPAASIDTCPSSMRLEGTPAGWPMRYIPYNGGVTLPNWLIKPPARPRVCLTLGSVLPGMGIVEVFGASLEAIRDCDVEVVACGGDTPSTSAPLPDNVRMVQWVPFSALLPTCAAIVHHGGSGTTFGALAAGVPQVVLPHGADQPWNAKAVAERGVGLALGVDHANAETIRECILRVLDEPAFQKAAVEVRDEIAALPPPSDIVARISQLVS